MEILKILALVVGLATDTPYEVVLDNFIKTQMELVATQEPPPAPTYQELVAQAIKENRPLLVSINKTLKDRKELVYYCQSFPDPEHPGRVLTEGIIMSIPMKGTLMFVRIVQTPMEIDYEKVCTDGSCKLRKR